MFIFLAGAVPSLFLLESVKISLRKLHLEECVWRSKGGDYGSSINDYGRGYESSIFGNGISIFGDGSSVSDDGSSKSDSQTKCFQNVCVNSDFLYVSLVSVNSKVRTCNVC